jgi:GNAT superfamily N-acetyltransferase
VSKAKAVYNFWEGFQVILPGGRAVEKPFIIRKIIDGDVERILKSFYWQQREQWLQYFEENQRGARVTLIAVQDDRIAGYTNLVWQSDYAPFRAQAIPEINNMHVLPEYQKQGIGTALVHAAEEIAAAANHATVGIGVAQAEDYADAQKLYPKLGYVPDGRGLRPTQWGDVLYLTKNVAR